MRPPSQNEHSSIKIVLALIATYLVWGSTYLAIRFGVESFPPFLMAGMRFLLAGLCLYGWLRFKGVPHPTQQQWLGAGVLGLMLLALGNGTVTYVQQTVASGLTALTIATAPLWMSIFAAYYGERPTRLELLGVLLGIVGIGFLSVGAELRANPFGVAMLIFAAATWSLGSVWSKRLTLPEGLMASAAQMSIGGVLLLIGSMVQGEAWPNQISLKSWLAFFYLVVFGSIVAYSAYLYLLKAVRPALASSNTFVNPIVAMILGAWLAGEAIGVNELIALLLIVVGVVLLLWGKHSQSS